ncbi:MAG: 16S rRNA (adenine(1518)-N(6)/adenine(1519)-N(6))-dimethyltransferase RsmA [Candidatus Nanohalobium sp.]
MNAQETLKKLGVKPVKGQNFLNSEQVVQALVEAGEVEDEVVLEIGAGTGVITEKLAEKAEKAYALETDTTLYNHLKEKFKGSNVEVLNKDFLEYEIPEDVTRCVSNLPFHIATQAVETLGEKQIQASVIVQKEFAEKILAEPGDNQYTETTLIVNYYYLPVKLRDVSSRSYHPEPEVNTSILKLYPNKDRHGIEDTENFFTVVKALFTNKRKKVRNSFVDARHILDISKDEAKKFRDELPHSEERPVELEIRELGEVAEAFRREFPEV